MIDLARFAGIIITPEEYMDGMADKTEGDQPGIDQEEESPAQKKHQEWGPPDEVAEINDVLTDGFHADG